MIYAVEGLDRGRFEHLFGLDDAALAGLKARRVTATSATGFPCRIALEDAAEQESLILLNFVSHDVATPFRTAYAIFVREDAGAPPRFEDRLPPMLDRRTLSLRAFDREGMLRNAVLAAPGEGDEKVRLLLQSDTVTSIHAHNAAYGCFLARIERN